MTKNKTASCYVGWGSAPHRTDLLQPVGAPLNLVNPEKIERALVERRARQQVDAMTQPYVSMVQHYVILDDHGEQILSSVEAPEFGMSPGQYLVRWMLNNFNFPKMLDEYDALPTLKDGAPHRGVIFYGYKVKEFMRMAAAEMLSPHVEQIDGEPPPVRLWYKRVYCVDPFALALHGASVVCPATLMTEFYNIDSPAPVFNRGDVTISDAAHEARSAMAMTEAQALNGCYSAVADPDPVPF